MHQHTMPAEQQQQQRGSHLGATPSTCASFLYACSWMAWGVAPLPSAAAAAAAALVLGALRPDRLETSPTCIRA